MHTSRKDMHLLVSQNRMKVDDCAVFFFREFTSLNIRPQIISPPQPAAFATPIKTSFLWKCPPTSMALLADIFHKLLIFFCCPWPFLHSTILLTAWNPTHINYTCISIIPTQNNTEMCLYLYERLSLSGENPS